MTIYDERISEGANGQVCGSWLVMTGPKMTKELIDELLDALKEYKIALSV